MADTLECGHHATPRGIAAGYATMPNGGRACYSCADNAQRAEMSTVNDYTGYLSSDGSSVTTWSGGVLARVTHEGSARTGFGGSSITYLRAVTPDGREWYGKNGGRGVYVTLHAVKAHRVAGH